MKNAVIIPSEIFETEGSNLLGVKDGTCISSADFVRENRAILAQLDTEKHSFEGVYHEFCNILTELVRRETFQKIQKSIDNLSTSSFY